MSKKSINSHIQITNLLMKNFNNSNGLVAYYDFKKDEIKEESSKKIGVKKGYYNEIVENFLNDEVENKVRNDIANIVKFANGELKELIIKDVSNLKKFIEYSIIRSENYIKKIINKLNKNNLELLNDYSNRDFHNIYIYFYDTIKNNTFEDLYMNILVNKSKTDFITLSNTIYQLDFQNYEHSLIFPLSPRVSIILSKRNNLLDLDKHHSSKKVKMYEMNQKEIFNDKLVEEMNRQAVIGEIFTSNKFIIGNKTQLQTLKEYKKYIDKLLNG